MPNRSTLASDNHPPPSNGRPFDERFAALDERVSNLRASFESLQSSTQRGFSHMEESLAAISREMAGNQRTPWIVIFSGLGVLLTFLGIVGGLVYLPIGRGLDELKNAQIKTNEMFNGFVSSLPQGFVTRQEQDWRAARGIEDRNRTENSILDIRETAVPRNEWLLRNDTVNVELSDIRRAIDQLRQDFGSTYGLRDALADLKDRLERVETMRATVPRVAP